MFVEILMGKIRAMIDFNGKNVDELLSSPQLKFWDMNEKANAGDEFLVVENEEEAKKLSDFKKSGKKKKIINFKDKTNIFDKEIIKKN